ncbi:MAG: hypothetical protein KAT74_01465, partial [Candidatus Cloacimonetes bacterium]|nr:hypothetical protein [Candidatus Cloacimonadota bacterium]
MRKIIIFVMFIFFIQNLVAVQMQQIETIPEQGLRTLYDQKNSFNIVNEKSTINSRDDRVSLLWQTSEPSAIAGCIAVSPVTGNSFVEWYLNDEYVALYADSAIPLWQYGASSNLDWEYPTDMTEDGSVLAFANMNTMNIFDPSSSTPTWQLTFAHNIRGLVLNTDGTRVFV